LYVRVDRFSEKALAISSPVSRIEIAGRFIGQNDGWIKVTKARDHATRWRWSAGKG